MKIQHISSQKYALLFTCMIVLVPLILLAWIILAAPASAATPEVLENPSGSISASIASAATPTATYERYRITIKNYFPWDIYVFLNNRFIMKVGPETTAYYSTIKEGTYSLKYCFDRQAEACEMASTVIVGRKTVLTAGKIPTPQPGVSVISDTETSSAYRLKIHNRSSFWVQVFMDGHYFFYIPSLKYVTYRPITTGTHIFRFCVANEYCWKDRRVEVSGDVELFIGP
jgi:hypothetical protein